MFPFSCFLSCDSKSNSSIRLPWTTTTRVSSGWEASISILLGIIFFPAGSRHAVRASGSGTLPPCSGEWVVLGYILMSACRRRSAMVVPPAAIVARYVCGPFHDCACGHCVRLRILFNQSPDRPDQLFAHIEPARMAFRRFPHVPGFRATGLAGTKFCRDHRCPERAPAAFATSLPVADLIG